MSINPETMRVCIVAEHASRRFGGEAVLPVHYFSQLRKRNIEAWLVVHSRTRSELEALFPEDQHRMRFITDNWLHKLLFRLSSLLPRRIAEMTLGLFSQLITQHTQRGIVRQLIAREAVNLVHQPIPVSPRFPSLMTNLGVPVVIGPMNGGMEYPAAFRGTESFISRTAVGIGRRLSGLVHSVLSGKKYASILLVANERTRLALPSCARGKIIEITENGVDMATWSASNTISDRSSSNRFIFIGRLVDWKGVDMAIEALSKVAETEPEAELEIIGDGPMRQAWQQLAENLDVGQRVLFSGFLPQSECAIRLQSAVALVLPSIYECGGAVVLEAMATGTPVIATRWGGPADYLDDTCGMLVEPSSHEAIVNGFADGMKHLLAAPELRRQLGASGKQRVLQYFDWEKKIDRILEIYRMAIGAQKPPHPSPTAQDEAPR